MSAFMSRPLADYTSTERTIDELDAAIGRLVRQMNAECYQMLVLVREFDDRFGWKKWSCKTCAEWLAWRSEIGLSAAREKVRTAHALRIAAGDLGGVCRRAAVVQQSAGADARRADARRRLAPGLCAQHDGRERRGALPADSQRRAGVGSSRAARVGESLVDDVARRRARPDAADGRGADRGRDLIARALDYAVAAGEVTTDWIRTLLRSPKARLGERSRPTRSSR